METATDNVSFEVGQGVSFWLGADGLGQVEDLHRTRVSVLYKRDGRLCRARVSAYALASRQRHHPLLFPAFNPFDRAIVRPRRKVLVERRLVIPPPTNPVPHGRT